MANFPTHITTSAILGGAYGTAAHVAYGVPLPSCLLAGGLCTVAGTLPDVDSDNAVVLREILAFVAAVIPMMLLDRFREMMWPQESIIVAAALIYVFVRFGVGELIRRVTVHRGMWHSIPAAIIVSCVVFYLCECPDMWLRWYKTGAVLIGYLWHLVLDEMYALDSGRGRVRVKRSFGTAFKLFGTNPITNLLVYGQLAAAIYLVYPPMELAHGIRDHAAHTHDTRSGPRPAFGYAPSTQMTPIPPLPSPPLPSHGGSFHPYATAPGAPPTYLLPGGDPRFSPIDPRGPRRRQ